MEFGPNHRRMGTGGHSAPPPPPPPPFPVSYTYMAPMDLFSSFLAQSNGFLDYTISGFTFTFTFTTFFFLVALFGILFKDDQEPAFSNLRLWQSVGFTISFAYSNFLCVWIKIIILWCILGVSVAGYLIVEMMVRRQQTEWNPSTEKQNDDEWIVFLPRKPKTLKSIRVLSEPLLLVTRHFPATIALRWYLRQQRVYSEVDDLINFLVRGKVRIKIRIRVGITFNVRVYHWSNNCRRSKCRTFLLQP